MERVSKMTDKDRQQKLVKEFKKIYGTGDAKKIRCFSSPGRLELSGNHTNHQGGGFAGSIIAFVPEDMTPDFIKKMDRFLKEGSCRRVSIRECGVYEISI